MLLDMYAATKINASTGPLGPLLSEKVGAIILIQRLRKFYIYIFVYYKDEIGLILLQFPLS